MVSTDVVIVLGIAAFVAFCVLIGVLGARARRRRAEEFQQFALAHGLQYVPKDNGLVRRWKGAPFAGHGDVRNVISGQYRGRPFTAFAYSYTTTSNNGQSTTTQTHAYKVWAIGLPGAVPDFSVGAEGIFGGKVAEALGFSRVNTGDATFDDAFKVKCRDERFGLRVLHPAVIDLLKQTGPWDWRFTGDTMLSWQPGTFNAVDVTAQLDRMTAVLDRIPADVWAYSSYGRG